jgi:hypothetical protein
MQNSPIVSRVVITLTAALCAVAALSMLLLEVDSLVVDLVYAGF